MKRKLDLNNPEDCVGCGACISSCPKKCFTLTRDKLGFSYPFFDKVQDCIDCGLCKKVCPQINFRSNSLVPVYTIYGQSLNEKELRESSSGAFFPVLAKYVLARNGFVWGVGMSSDGNTRFECIEEERDLIKLMGSKYSEVLFPLNHRKVKEQLDTDRLVLVSGTPCQILGLKNYLGSKVYSNLILVDLLCYGIQSPKMWRCYLDEINPLKKGIAHINMRAKNISWFNYSMNIDFDDGTRYNKIRYYDSWLRSYSTSIFNRPSCSVCQAKKFPRVSDFTIGDFWGIDYFSSSTPFDKRKGISLVFANTEWAKKNLKMLSNDFRYTKLSVETVMKILPSLSKSSPTSPIREEFIDCVYRTSFSKAVDLYIQRGVFLWYKKRKMYIKYITIGRIKRIVKKIIGYKK